MPQEPVAGVPAKSPKMPVAGGPCRYRTGIPTTNNYSGTSYLRRVPLRLFYRAEVKRIHHGHQQLQRLEEILDLLL